MKKVFVLFVFLSLGGLLPFADTSLDPKLRKAGAEEKKEAVKMNSKLEKLVGKWKGTCKTWFEPGKLADESPIEGEFRLILNGKFIRHSYTGAIMQKARSGEETIVRNSITENFEVVWFDSFHMNYAIMVSSGKETEKGFSVKGEYDTGKSTPRWGWQTDYEFSSDDKLTITAYNISPEGESSKATETVYERVK